MDFDFLPDLPKSDLDDRKFNDLVEECRLRIPRYCPEWTNYNPGDPGITLVELFAWLTDQMLMRFNQVPRRNYVVFLELMGIRLQPPTPAQAALTFRLTTDTRLLPLDQRTILAGAEVATVRTETEAAVVFTTDHDLVIGRPQLKYFLTANVQEDNPKYPSHPQNEPLVNPFRNTLTEQNQQWEAIEETAIFDESHTRPGNRFYLVLTEPGDRLEGAVIAVNFKGRAATGTGIDPESPPLRWEAWNGEDWQDDILLEPQDDKTKGFSFNEVAAQGPHPLNDGADVILHLPLKLPKVDFGTGYEGYWIRCVFRRSQELEQPYSVSPRIRGLGVRAIGGAVTASECVRVEEELLGISNGKPNQLFQLQGTPVLEDLQQPQTVRRSGEHIKVKLPSQQLEEVEPWTEVRNFAASGAEDLHYLIDSLSGGVQFGPLVQEPEHLKQQTQFRQQIQPQESLQAWGRTTGRENNGATLLPTSNLHPDTSEQQYGKVPPLGAEVYMMAYRTGGGSRGNVRPHKLTVLKTSIPYVKTVTNYKAATGGTDEESLAQAVMRVPKLLRSREAAVTPEDFERVVGEYPEAARVCCPRNMENDTGGMVRLLIVPVPDPDSVNVSGTYAGMNPDDALLLSEGLKGNLQTYMRDRKPLGIRLELDQPKYIGVSVHLEVIPEPKYNNDAAGQRQIRSHLLDKLYRFLNPIEGGSFDSRTGEIKGNGWQWGRSVYQAEILALCRTVPGILHLGAVELYRLEKDHYNWRRSTTSELAIELQDSQLACSWANDELGSSHKIRFVGDRVFQPPTATR